MTTQSFSTLAPLLECLNAGEKEFVRLYNRAAQLTAKHFGNRRTLFNPVYVSDICLADCSYCGFRVSNKGLPRKTLKPFEAAQEARFLRNRGVENILVLAGDYKHAKYVEMLCENIRAIKREVNPKWLGIEVATLEVDEYRRLKEAGAESVTVFQETYNRRRYSALHENPEYKGDFDFRLGAQERAIQAGFGEVGFGVLYGIGFWKEDTVAMAEHALGIQEKYPDVKLRFSFPRLQGSEGQSEHCKTEYVGEQELLQAVVGIRLAFPEATLVLTGRETVEFLSEQANIVNTIGFAGSTVVGGYSLRQGVGQFYLQKQARFEEFLNALNRFEIG